MRKKDPEYTWSRRIVKGVWRVQIMTYIDKPRRECIARADAVSVAKAERDAMLQLIEEQGCYDACDLASLIRSSYWGCP